MSIKALKSKLEKLNQCLEDENNEGNLTALNSTLDVYKKRMLAGLDSNLETLGKYVSYWKKIRDKKGKQTNYKDLFFEGNMYRDIQTGTSGGQLAIGFLTDKSRLIMQGQENFVDSNIRSLSKEEKKILSESINEQRKITIERCLGK